MAIHTVVRILLLLGVSTALVKSARLNRLRVKDSCPPVYEITVKQRVNAPPNFLRGPCETREGGRDTCRRRMSCCENFQGAMICIRARAYKSKMRPQALPPPQFPPMPPMNDIMQNDVEIRNPLCPTPMPPGETCMGDIMAKFCGSDNECSPNRICCPDPCSSDFLPTNLCLLPADLTNNNVQPDIFAPPQVSAAGNSKQPSTALPTEKVPATESKPSQPPTSATAESADANITLHPSCPKPEEPKCNEDGTICAVACASYDASHIACTDQSTCAPTGRICCPDPCPNSQTKLCFPDGSQDSGKSIASVAKVQR